MTEPSPEAPALAPSAAWQMSACFEILNEIQEQIRYADTKAGFIAAFNVLLWVGSLVTMVSISWMQAS